MAKPVLKEVTFHGSILLDTQRCAVAKYICSDLWPSKAVTVEQGVGSEVFFFRNRQVRDLWKQKGCTSSIDHLMIQFIGGSKGFVLRHNTVIDERKLDRRLAGLASTYSLPVHIYFERMTRIMRANDEEFNTVFTYDPQFFEWHVATEEAEEQHSLIGGSGQTPEHACHSAWEDIAAVCNDWGYENPFADEVANHACS
jgi:hypothetical protein